MVDRGVARFGEMEPVPSVETPVTGHAAIRLGTEQSERNIAKAESRFMDVSGLADRALADFHRLGKIHPEPLP